MQLDFRSLITYKHVSGGFFKCILKFLGFGGKEVGSTDAFIWSGSLFLSNGVPWVSSAVFGGLRRRFFL